VTLIALQENSGRWPERAAASSYYSFRFSIRHFCLTLVGTGRGFSMSTYTVTAEGQITLQKDVLEHLGVRPGEKITVNKLPDGKIEVMAARQTGKISDVFGILKDKRIGKALSIEEMNDIIAEGWARKR
jgi:AbrB family looped-hinge helix DNA binding protein